MKYPLKQEAQAGGGTSVLVQLPATGCNRFDSRMAIRQRNESRLIPVSDLATLAAVASAVLAGFRRGCRNTRLHSLFFVPETRMLIGRASATNLQSSGYDLDSRPDTVGEMLNGYDGSPVSKSLIRRAVLRSILHQPRNHNADEAPELFYKALDQATGSGPGRKTRSKFGLFS